MSPKPNHVKGAP